MNESVFTVAEPSAQGSVHLETIQQPAYSPSGRRARLLVVDRPGWVYHGSTAVSNASAELEVVGRALDIADATRLAAQTRPDVVVVNLPADAKRAIDTIQQLHQLLPETRIIAFASQATGVFIRAATDSGASGLLFKDDNTDMLAEVVRTVLEGNRYYSPEWMSLFLGEKEEQENFDPRVLTAREWDVIKLIYEGMTSRSIGRSLGIKLTTVHAHRSNIMKKLSIHKVPGLVKWYEQHRKHLQ